MSEPNHPVHRLGESSLPTGASPSRSPALCNIEQTTLPGLTTFNSFRSSPDSLPRCGHGALQRERWLSRRPCRRPMGLRNGVAEELFPAQEVGLFIHVKGIPDRSATVGRETVFGKRAGAVHCGEDHQAVGSRCAPAGPRSPLGASTGHRPRRARQVTARRADCEGGHHDGLRERSATPPGH